jgi:hypothetical protein
MKECNLQQWHDFINSHEFFAMADTDGYMEDITCVLKNNILSVVAKHDTELLLHKIIFNYDDIIDLMGNDGFGLDNWQEEFDKFIKGNK